MKSYRSLFRERNCFEARNFKICNFGSRNLKLKKLEICRETSGGAGARAVGVSSGAGPCALLSRTLIEIQYLPISKFVCNMQDIHSTINLESIQFIFSLICTACSSMNPVFWSSSRQCLEALSPQFVLLCVQ